MIAILLFVNYIISFFFPQQIKTISGKQLNLRGDGPPVLFSPGLFGMMPDFFYNNLIDELKKNNTIITINDFSPISQNNIKEICNTIKVDKIGYIGHSSFDPNIINNNKYIKSALFIDPINIPFINFILYMIIKLELNFQFVL